MFNELITKIILRIIPKDARKERVRVILNDKIFKLIIKKPKSLSSEKFRKSIEKLYDTFRQ